MNKEEYFNSRDNIKKQRDILYLEYSKLDAKFIKSQTNLKIGDVVFHMTFGGEKKKTTIKNIIVRNGEVIVQVYDKVGSNEYIPLMLDEVIISREKKIENILNNE